MYSHHSRYANPLKRETVINERHPLNPQYIKVGSAHFNALCQTGRLDPQHSTETSSSRSVARLFKDWQQKRPDITAADALLLADVGDIAFRLYALPLSLIIYIANFLYPSDDQHKAKRSKPLEWLILSALYRQINPENLYNLQLQKEIEQKEYLRILFYTLLCPTPNNLADATTNKNHQEVTTVSLLEAAIKESEHAVVVTAVRAAYQLTESDNAQQLIAVSFLGTYAQKTSTLYYLLNALCGKYVTCKLNFKDKNLQHQQAYTSTRRYFYFIKGYYSSWLKELKKSKLSDKTIEYTIVNDYPKYLSCANEVLRDYKPQHKPGLLSKLTKW